QVIHNGNSAKSPVAVIIEAKSPGNKSEMPSAERLNSKALQEILLYYLRERITTHNTELKNLVVTNLYQWFIFDAQQFEKLFASHKKLVQNFEDFEAQRLSGKTTDFFYRHIAAPAIDEVKHQLEYTWYDLRQYFKPLQNDDPGDDHKLIPLFKILAPEHLLKLPFANDSNSLNRNFYAELLHIIGLQEQKDKGKKIIERLPADERHPASLLENTIIKLESRDYLSRLENKKQFGATREEQTYNVALELVITWVNRILFLKLLEAQLVSYHRGDKAYTFLHSDLLQNYDDLDALFFQVLASEVENRTGAIAEKFAHVPYLNSSLFEGAEMEFKTMFISNLQDELSLPLHKSTVLKDEKGRRRKGEMVTLDYLLQFLNAFDFSSEGGEEIQEENKTLINASVLGLIFEKINGYKDGSFFTPGFITMYMCRETIRRAVLQKFNERKNWHCTNFEDLYNKIDDRTEANQIVNSLKICDPAVGSGHFLVSALNEIIALKSELNILQDKDGKTLRDYDISIANDELIITDENGDFLRYYPQSKESQRVQETLFHEKQTLIENCLFGVDINPNSVKICRLRLWIELLKNAYYRTPRRNGEAASSAESAHPAAAGAALETLPNIDINIKCGNSLISRFGLEEDLKKALRKSKYSIEVYQSAVKTYHHAESKEQKRQMEKLIADIKSDFRTEINANSKEAKRLYKVEGEVTNMLTQLKMFDLGKKEKAEFEQKLKKYRQEADTLRDSIEAIRNNAIYEQAFEWRFEFPEVLDEDGAFTGFDTIIGNPPYIRQEELKAIKPYLQQGYSTYTSTADMYVYFVELGLQLLQEGGQFVYILPNKWMRAGYGAKLRNYLQTTNIESIVDFGDLPVFEEATTYPCIMRIKKEADDHRFESVTIKSLDFEETLPAYVQQNAYEVDSRYLQPAGWTLTDVSVQKLLAKLRSKGTPLGEYVDGKIYRGVLTGLNEAFVIDRAKREALIAEDPGSADIIKPFLAGRDIKRYKQPESDKFLILFRSGDTREWFGDKLTEKEAFARISEAYPAVMKHLGQYEANAKKRHDRGHYWWELRACDYYEEFEKEKIAWPETSMNNQFTKIPAGAYLNKTAFFIPSNDLFLLGLLNSKVTLFYLDAIVSKMRGGYFSLSKAYVETMPIVLTTAFEQKISNLTKASLVGEKAKTQELDQFIFSNYDLSNEEIKVIENSIEPHN
ncbi:MAG: Eco57I restriction-modification methylase domain-containing protein, partial [Schleiferiaceae bacterium]|nr:Eco57I restriction-modification methylase domain-containing protein [Schleiferiaceae bacterium]